MNSCSFLQEDHKCCPRKSFRVILIYLRHVSGRNVPLFLYPSSFFLVINTRKTRTILPNIYRARQHLLCIYSYVPPSLRGNKFCYTRTLIGSVSGVTLGNFKSNKTKHLWTFPNDTMPSSPLTETDLPSVRLVTTVAYQYVCFFGDSPTASVISRLHMEISRPEIKESRERQTQSFRAPGTSCGYLR